MELDSGAKLAMTLAPFSDGHNLFKAFAKELEQADLDPNGDALNPMAIKNLFCRLAWSKDVEKCLWDCMKRATYNGVKITPDLFEEEDAREDFIIVCSEVGSYNLGPFTKSLYAKYLPGLEALKATQE